MTFSQPAPRPDDTAHRRPGPNQWIKDHLDSLIDAQLLTGRPDAPGGAADRQEGPTP
ncbi:hypothetical protein AB0E81_36935 [Streptomyces sp. NPDC033538]|uniref:hypothetical protein n=1 Tax=Streptomyces sp. NPDC033538 TaxID=3155367 RepID=UPI003407D348